MINTILQRYLYRKKSPPTPAMTVTGSIVQMTNPKDPKNWQQCRNMELKMNYVCLGLYTFQNSALLTPEILRDITSKAGGDYYFYNYALTGIGHGTRMMMTGFTTPSVISSTSQGSAYGNYSGTYNGNNGYYGNTYGNASAYGYGSSQTVVGGTQSYQAVPFEYPIIINYIAILASPERQLELIKAGVVTQDSLNSYSLAARENRAKVLTSPR